MKKSTKLTLTAVLLIIVFNSHTSVCKAEYNYWFWDSLAEPIGLITDIGGAAVHGVGGGLSGLWKGIFGKSKREPVQTDLSGNPLGEE